MQDRRVVAGMIAGADSIDDLDMLRQAGLTGLFDGVYAPSTLGSFLRAFTHGHVRQLQAVDRDCWPSWPDAPGSCPAPAALTLAGHRLLLRRVYGQAKQGAGFGHAKVGGYTVRLRGLQPADRRDLHPDRGAGGRPATRLRGGNAASARGRGIAGRRGHHHRPRRRRHRVSRGAGRTRRSTTPSSSPRAGAAGCGSRSPPGWTPRSAHDRGRSATTRGSGSGTRRPIWDEEEQRWISDAQVAETTYTAFAARPGTR